MAGITFSEGSGVNDSIFGKSQAPIRMLIEKRAEAFEQNSGVDKIFTEEKSDNWAEKFTSLTAMDGFDPVGENGAYPLDEMQESYSKTLQHETWKGAFTISRELIEDAKEMDLKKKPAGFVQSFYRRREDFGAALMGNALQGNTSVTYRGKAFDTTAADTLCLYSTGHTSKVTAATQSNVFSNAFSADVLAAVEEKMQNFKGDRGELLNVIPNTIIIPNQYALKKAVFAAIGADKDPATANNGFNFLFGRWTVIVWPYLDLHIGSGTSPWILADLDYNEQNGGAILTNRVPLTVRSTYDEGTDANIWRGRTRFTGGFNDWRAFAAGGVSGGTTLTIA